MTTLAIYSSKGGVGKTSLAVNLAWASATLSSRRTLLWDLDAQGGASFILAPDRAAGDQARAVIERDLAPARLIVPTGIERLDLLPADSSLRTLDLLFARIDRKKRLLRIGEALARDYDRIVIDCPPGLGVSNSAAMPASATMPVGVGVSRKGRVASPTRTTIRAVRPSGLATHVPRSTRGRFHPLYS